MRANQEAKKLLSRSAQTGPRQRNPLVDLCPLCGGEVSDPSEEQYESLLTMDREDLHQLFWALGRYMLTLTAGYPARLSWCAGCARLVATGELPQAALNLFHGRPADFDPRDVPYRRLSAEARVAQRERQEAPLPREQAPAVLQRWHADFRLLDYV